MKWRRGILVCGLIVVGVVIGISVSGRKEPSYEGKSLHTWLKSYSGPNALTADVVEEAVLHIGTNAIPFLLDDLEYVAPA